MANAYVQYMIQRSLADIGLTLDEIPSNLNINTKKTPKSKSNDCLTSNDEFDFMFSKNTIDSLLNHFKPANSVPCEAIMRISKQDGDCIRRVINTNRKERDLVSFVDYRFIVRALKKGHGPLKFVDQNEMTKPMWLRKSDLNISKKNIKKDKITLENHQNGKICISISEDEHPSTKKHARNEKTTDDMINNDFKYLCEYNQENLCFFDVGRDFWDNLKTQIQSKPLIKQIKEKQDVLLSIDDTLIKKKKVNTKRKKTWRQTNDVMIKQHVNIMNDVETDNHCLWQKISILISKTTSDDENDQFTENTLSEVLTLLDQLTKEYLSFIGDDKIRIHPSEVNSLFLSKHKNQMIIKMNQCHYDHRSSITSKHCHVCDTLKQNGTMKHIIIYTSYLMTKIMSIDYSNNVSKLFNDDIE